MIVLNLEEFGMCDLSFYLGLEKFALNNIDDDCFFIWNINKSIIIGKNQILDMEVNVDIAHKNGFKIYRRPSGGGAIFADEGCFMYTFITSHKSKDEIYQNYLSKIVEALNKLGLDIILSGRNDLIFKNKKFSGSAIYYENNKSVLHGTFLYNSNLDLLVEVLNPNDSKLQSKGIRSVKERVINLKEYLPFSKSELISYLNHNIDSNIEYLSLNKEQISEVLKYKEIFDDKDNIYKKSPPFTYKNSIRYPIGEIEVYINVERGIIKDFNLYGDFFNLKDLNQIYAYYLGKEYCDIIKISKNISISDYISGLDNADYIRLFT